MSRFGKEKNFLEQTDGEFFGKSGPVDAPMMPAPPKTAEISAESVYPSKQGRSRRGLGESSGSARDIGAGMRRPGSPASTRSTSPVRFEPVSERPVSPPSSVGGSMSDDGEESLLGSPDPVEDIFAEVPGLFLAVEPPQKDPKKEAERRVLAERVRAFQAQQAVDVIAAEEGAKRQSVRDTFVAFAACNDENGLLTMLEDFPDLIDEKNTIGDTALIAAAKHGCLDAVFCLLDCGADHQIKSEGKTAFEHAQADEQWLMEQWHTPLSASEIIEYESSLNEARLDVVVQQRIRAQKRGEDTRAIIFRPRPLMAQYDWSQRGIISKEISRSRRIQTRIHCFNHAKRERLETKARARIIAKEPIHTLTGAVIAGAIFSPLLLLGPVGVGAWLGAVAVGGFFGREFAKPYDATIKREVAEQCKQDAVRYDEAREAEEYQAAHPNAFHPEYNQNWDLFKPSPATDPIVVSDPTISSNSPYSSTG